VRIADPKKLPRILDAAATLFAERPFDSVHMKEIAALAGVAKGTLYLHFVTKEALFRAMIAEVSGKRLDEVEARIAAASGPIEGLRILVRDAVRFSARYPHYLETLHNLDGNPPRDADAVIRDERERLYALIERILRGILCSGDTKPCESERATLALLGMMHRVMTFTPTPWPENLADWIVDLLLYGISGSGQEA
jgi:AcrR family transcriptional regulator